MQGRGYKWTEDEIDALIRSYASDEFAKDFAARMEIPVVSVYNKAQRLGLRKPESFRSRAGKKGTLHPKAIASRFRKGHIPDNKGKKVSAEVYAKMAPTMFKPGHSSDNRREVGSERVNVDGYREIKVAEPSRWKLLHRVVWEKANGPIPKGCNIQFKDRNPLNCELDNLYIINRRDQMNDNSIHRYPQELVEVIRLKGTIKRRINKTKRDGKEHKSGSTQGKAL